MRTTRLLLVAIPPVLGLVPCPAASQDAPPGTDIFLAPLTGGGLAVRVGEARNVTVRPGYDNQPFFLPDGSGFLFTAIDSTGQADIWRYDLEEDRLVQVTHTSPESEYSPTPLLDGSGFSAVRVEADSTQRLWRFDMDGSSPELLLSGVQPVGYHAWADERTLVLFVLGQPATLQVADLRTGRATLAHRDVGRSIQRIPGGGVSFVDRAQNGDTWISTWQRGAVHPLVPALDNGDFHAWTPDGTLLMGSGSIIRAWRPDRGGDEWVPVGSLAAHGATVSRLAVSPDGRWIAVVGQIPGG